MPAIVAHYLLGQQVLEKLKNPMRDLILKNKEMFDIGLQGPDILFFYKPYLKNQIVAYGHKIHNYNGYTFFSEVLNVEDVTEDYIAYIFGVVCHYCLDRNCHPYVNSVSNNCIAHQTLESDFDYYLIKKYELSEKRYIYLPKKNLNYSVISKAYKVISKKKIKKSVYSMNKYVKMLEYEKLLNFIERVISKEAKYSSLAVKNKKANPLDILKLKLFFDEAVFQSVMLIRQVFNSYINKELQLTDFNMDFEGNGSLIKYLSS